MVGWFDPQVLAQTALHMTMANVFGRHSDARLIEALANQPQGVFDYSDAPGEFWLDYVSDIGDGWNSTYGVARAIALPALDADSADDTRHRTQRGNVLIFGGDEVYPYPTRDAYLWRTEFPYSLAFHGEKPRPDLFAIPGNHDWFDSLVAFSRLFCRPDRGFAGLRTRQTRSYFALKLPANWWLVALDMQLGTELDEPQVRYLERVASEMQPEARVILCVPEPQWVYETTYPGYRVYAAHSLQAIEQQILRRPVRLFLTGDLHHYQRHANAEGVQKVISGGGGAFLHPTHAPDTRVLTRGFERAATYPDIAASSRLAWRNLLFPFLNPKSLVLPALLYGLSAWFASASLGPGDVQSFGGALEASLNAAIRDPLNGLWLLACIGAFVFFTDTHVGWYRAIGGTAHAVAHLFAAFTLAWLALVMTTQWMGLEYGGLPQLALSGLFTAFAGGIVGGFVLGAYLLVSLQLFGRHSNEAFSSLRIADYKQWLRLRIARDGTLTAWSIGIDRVPHRWRRDEPVDPRATAPRVVDRFEVR